MARPPLEKYKRGLVLALTSEHNWPWLIAGSAVFLSVAALLPRKRMDERWFPYITAAERDARFGPLRAVPAPTAANPEAIQITNDFPRNIVRVHIPELIGVKGAPSGTIELHRDAAESLEAVFRDLKKRGLLKYVRSFNGSYVPRFVRGSATTLSSHSYGTSVDINADTNPQGNKPTPEQEKIARVFAEHGWFWGDWFPTRDPHHFEYLG